MDILPAVLSDPMIAFALMAASFYEDRDHDGLSPYAWHLYSAAQIN